MILALYWIGFAGAVVGILGSDKGRAMKLHWQIVFAMFWFLFLIGHHMSVVLEAE
tara:strand:+ start:461 stop:625 length:165 start_codon:yes stop_codon:yes gene_type:complete